MIAQLLSKITVTLERQKWVPPVGNRFVEYDDNDEHWMRPLRLGEVRQVREEVTYPHCYIESMTPTSVTFRPVTPIV